MTEETVVCGVLGHGNHRCRELNTSGIIVSEGAASIRRQNQEREKMRLIFVRHGEPDYKNDCLTENGILQAKATAKRLKQEKISAVYASPMGRALQTASFTAGQQGLEVTQLPFMHEIDWGTTSAAAEEGREVPYDGHPWTLACKLLTEEPQYIGSDAWREHPYFRDNRLLAEYRKVSAGLDAFLAEHGLKRRGREYICSRFGNPEDPFDENIALFAHGGSGAVLFAHLLNLPLPFVLTALPYGVCSISIFALWPEQSEVVIPRLEIFNDMGHLANVRQEKLHFGK